MVKDIDVGDFFFTFQFKCMRKQQHYTMTKISYTPFQPHFKRKSYFAFIIALKAIVCSEGGDFTSRSSSERRAFI